MRLRRRLRPRLRPPLSRSADRELLSRGARPGRTSQAIALTTEVMPHPARRHRVARVQQHPCGRGLWHRVHIEMRGPAASRFVAMHILRHRRDPSSVFVHDGELQACSSEDPREIAHRDVAAALDARDARLRHSGTCGEISLAEVRQPSGAPHMTGAVEDARRSERRARRRRSESVAHRNSVAQASDIPTPLAAAPAAVVITAPLPHQLMRVEHQLVRSWRGAAAARRSDAPPRTRASRTSRRRRCGHRGRRISSS